MAKSSTSSGPSLSDLVAGFDKTNKGYIQWCGARGFATQSNTSVMQYIAANGCSVDD